GSGEVWVVGSCGSRTIRWGIVVASCGFLGGGAVSCFEIVVGAVVDVVVIFADFADALSAQH
ncbi:hypothetical protein ACHAXS_004766, partial [Conticribra weissflogii]